MQNTYGLKNNIFFCDSSIPAQTWISHSGTHTSTGTCCESAKTDKKENIKYKDANKRLQMIIPAWKPNPQPVPTKTRSI
jgi:hypothetical protein